MTFRGIRNSLYESNEAQNSSEAWRGACVTIIQTYKYRHTRSCILSISHCHRNRAVARIQEVVSFLSDQSQEET